MRKNKHIGQLGSGGSSPRVLDLYPTTREGWATSSLLSTYDSGAAFVVKDSVNKLEHTVYFSGGELSKANFNSLFGANDGHVVAIYNHADGSIFRTTGNYGASGFGSITSSPKIWDGVSGDFTKDVTGNIILSFDAANSFTYTPWAGSFNMSTFLIQNRNNLPFLAYWGVNLNTFLFIVDNTTASMYSPMTVNPVGIYVNSVEVTPQTRIGLRDATSVNMQVLSATGYTVNGGVWTDFILGGYPSGGYNYESDLIGEIIYAGDEDADEVNITTELITQFNITI